MCVFVYYMYARGQKAWVPLERGFGMVTRHQVGTQHETWAEPSLQPLGQGLS